MQVKDLSVEQLKALIRETVTETLDEYLDDPDWGLEVNQEVKNQLLEIRQRRQAGKRGIPAAQVYEQLGGKPMQLEDYFEFLHPDDIRIKGHRIGIDDVLKYYLEGYTPQQILEQLPTLNLEKVYATLTYYYHNQAEINAYLKRLEENQEQNYQQWLASEPSPVVKRLRQIKAQREQGEKILR